MARDGALASSLPLQIILYFHGWFSALFFGLTLLLLVYKGYDLPYPSAAYGLEIVLCLFFGLTEASRVFSMSLGNRTEQIGPLAFGIAMSVVGILCHVYFLRLQTYVLKIEVPLNSIAFGFYGLEVVMGVLTAVSFWSANRF